jgi:hypothetical protein
MLLYALFLFIIIYVAVRLAIIPLTNKDNSFKEDKQEFDLSKLHDIGLLSDEEFTEIIELYWNEEQKKENTEYKNASKVLFELKNKGIITIDEFNEKFKKLKQYYKIDA